MLIMKTNFHTHSTFCDGKDSPEENAIAAVQKGFDTLGFSSHAELPFSDDWHLKVERFSEYEEEINRLKEKFSGKLNIRLGFEADFIPGITEPTYETYGKFKPDFLIGSVHFVYNGKGIFEADGNAESIHDAIEKFYGGNAKEAVIRYFEEEREMIEHSRTNGMFQIIGHADLIRKSNRKSNLLGKGMDFFDENESWYKEQIRLTADKIAGAGIVAEINTGAIARNNMKTPYPSEEFLALLKERNVPITINSDAHSKEALDYAFEKAVALAKKTGYNEAVSDIIAGKLTFTKF